MFVNDLSKLAGNKKYKMLVNNGSQQEIKQETIKREEKERRNGVGKFNF